MVSKPLQPRLNWVPLNWGQLSKFSLTPNQKAKLLGLATGVVVFGIFANVCTFAYFFGWK